MEQITTEAQIKQVLANMDGLENDLTILLGAAQKARVKLKMDFTSDCDECGPQSATMREARKLYYNALDILTSFQTALNKLKNQIDPQTSHNKLNKVRDAEITAMKQSGYITNN